MPEIPPKVRKFFGHWMTRGIIGLIVLGGVGNLAGGAAFLLKGSAWVAHSKAGGWLVPVVAFWVLLSPWFVAWMLRKDASVATISPASAYLGQAKELLPVAERSRYKVSEADWALTFEKDYSVRHRFTMKIAAVDRSLFVIRQHRSSSVAALDLSMLDFQANWVGDGGAVVTIPAVDNPHKREFLVFCEPPLEPGSPARVLEVKSRWPNASRRLQELNDWDQNGWTIPGQVVGAVDRLNLELAFEESLGGTFVVRLRCSHEESAKPDETVKAGASWSHSVDNVPVGAVVSVSVKRLSLT